MKYYPGWKKSCFIWFTGDYFRFCPQFMDTTICRFTIFRPYKIGVNIHDDMIVPEGAPAMSTAHCFTTRKDGVVKEFDESNYPWNDSTWTFVDSKSTLVKGIYAPNIKFLPCIPWRVRILPISL